MGYNPSAYRSEKFCPREHSKVSYHDLCPDHPVENVSPAEVKVFLERLNTVEGAYRYRLPTAAEWDYFAGSLPEDLDHFAWISPFAKDHTHSVATKMPNEFKLFDIYGNVSEWITGGIRSRGCGYDSSSAGCLTARSDSYSSEGNDQTGYYTVGFRLVRVRR